MVEFPLVRTTPLHRSYDESPFEIITTTTRLAPLQINMSKLYRDCTALVSLDDEFQPFRTIPLTKDFVLDIQQVHRGPWPHDPRRWSRDQFHRSHVPQEIDHKHKTWGTGILRQSTTAVIEECNFQLYFLDMQKPLSHVDDKRNVLVVQDQIFRILANRANCLMTILFCECNTLDLFVLGISSQSVATAITTDKEQLVVLEFPWIDVVSSSSFTKTATFLRNDKFLVLNANNNIHNIANIGCSTFDFYFSSSALFFSSFNKIQLWKIWQQSNTHQMEVAGFIDRQGNPIPLFSGSNEAVWIPIPFQVRFHTHPTSSETTASHFPSPEDYLVQIDKFLDTGLTSTELIATEIGIWKIVFQPDLFFHEREALEGSCNIYNYFLLLMLTATLKLIWFDRPFQTQKDHILCYLDLANHSPSELKRCVLRDRHLFDVSFFSWEADEHFDSTDESLKKNYSTLSSLFDDD